MCCRLAGANPLLTDGSWPNDQHAGYRCGWRRVSMITSSNGNGLRVTGPYWPLLVDSPHKGPVTRAFMFSLMFVQTNVQTNRRDAGDLRRHRAHYGVTVMSLKFWGHGFESKLQLMKKRHLPCCQYTGTLFSCVLHTKWHLHTLASPTGEPPYSDQILYLNKCF